MSQGTRDNTGHGDGPRRTPGSSHAVNEADLAREMGELSASIRHLDGSVNGLSRKLDRIDGTLTDHSDRLARLEERPTRKDYDLVGARLTASEKRIALIVAALIVATSGAGAVANILKLIGGV